MSYTDFSRKILCQELNGCWLLGWLIEVTDYLTGIFYSSCNCLSLFVCHCLFRHDGVKEVTKKNKYKKNQTQLKKKQLIIFLGKYTY
jgi:hypothetical protein